MNLNKETLKLMAQISNEGCKHVDLIQKGDDFAFVLDTIGYLDSESREWVLHGTKNEYTIRYCPACGHKLPKPWAKQERQDNRITWSSMFFTGDENT